MPFSKRRWDPALTVLIGMALTSVAMYPGFLNLDAQWQFQQARIGVYNNEHPPLMAFAWRYLNFVAPGPAGLFLFHSLLFWIGFALFIDALAENRIQALGASLAAIMFLPLLASFGVLVKDGGFAYALVLASGALMRARRARSIPWIALSMAAIFYAVALRHNGVFAALPLTLWAGWLLAPRWRALTSRLGKLKSAAVIGATLFLYQAAGTTLANRLLTDIEAYPAQMMLTWDLTGISALSGRNYLPISLDWDYRPLTVDELRKIYSPDTNFYVLWGGQPKPGWVFTGDDYEDLKRAWFAAIREQPAAYLHHRSSAFISFLGYRATEDPYWLPHSADVLKDGGWNAPIRAWLVRLVNRHPNFILFKAGFYLLIVTICMALGAHRKLDSPAFWAISSSGVMYTISYFFVSTAGEFRYSWWLMCVALMVPALLFAPGISVERS